MNRKRVLVGVVISLVLLAVVAYGVVAMSSSRQRPFSATSFEYVTEEGELEGSECPAAEVNVVGKGTGTHLGEYTIVRRHCFTPPDHPAFTGSVMHDGTFEITAANGDKLWGTYSGGLEPTEFGENGPVRGILRGNEVITGGSGRFEGAQGKLSSTADYDLVADEGNFTIEGWISY